MNEIKSIGPWPENSITDLNNARVKLDKAIFQLSKDLEQEINEYVGFPLQDFDSNIPTLYLPIITSKILDNRLQQTEVTYRQFIERNKDRPFCVYIPYQAVHFPFQGPNDEADRIVGGNYWSKAKYGRRYDDVGMGGAD